MYTMYHIVNRVLHVLLFSVSWIQTIMSVLRSCTTITRVSIQTPLVSITYHSSYKLSPPAPLPSPRPAGGWRGRLPWPACPLSTLLVSMTSSNSRVSPLPAWLGDQTGQHFTKTVVVRLFTTCPFPPTPPAVSTFPAFS